MSEIDLTLALQLQAQFEEEARVHLLQQEVKRRKAEEIAVVSSRQGNQNNSTSSSDWRTKGGVKDHLEEPDQDKLTVSLVDPSWELIDPNPDIHSLFIVFNKQFFWGRLMGVEVKWSPRMTLCAGVCSYEGRGGLCSVRLSVPLLKLRPRKDLIETLLHEMIHAYLFVTANNRDRDGHGPEFHKHMYRINRVAGTKISVYHSFHDEVDVYRQHVWRCDGPCRTRRPYFGLVKRAMNRAPGPRDPWWQQHQTTCGGSYTKIQEPEGYGNKKKDGKGKVVSKDTSKHGDIRKYIDFKGKGHSLSGPSSIPTGSRSKENIPAFSNATGNDRSHGVFNSREDKMITGTKVKRKTGSDDGVTPNPFGNSAKAGKKDKVHGFSSTATRTVNHLDVNNASKSNVHGFGDGGLPAKKKPNRGSSTTSVGTGRGRGKLGGNRNGTSTGSNSGFTTGTAKPGSGGGGLAVRGRGGSTTMTVKGRGTTVTESKTVNEVEKNIGSSATFQGAGNTLGGSRVGVSRLLSLTTSTVPKSQKASSQKASEDSLQSQQNSENHTNCPLCDENIPESKLTQHLDDCMGMFEESMDISDGSEVEVDNSRVQDQSDKCIVLDSSCEISSEESTNDQNRKSEKKRENNSMGDEHERNVYPCPVCGEKYSESAMNSHLDSHF